jgi:hypothetical protein
VPEDPPQHPHWKSQLRLRSVPTALDPALGWRFLRHDRNPVVVLSYSVPSGLTFAMIQITRLFTAWALPAKRTGLTTKSGQAQSCRSASTPKWSVGHTPSTGASATTRQAIGRPAAEGPPNPLKM